MTPFDTFDDFMWATGVIFWLIMLCVAAGIVLHILHGLVCSISLTLFRARGARRHGHRIGALRTIGASFGGWWEMVGHHNNGSNKIVLPGGASWRGPFDFDKV